MRVSGGLAPRLSISGWDETGRDNEREHIPVQAFVKGREDRASIWRFLVLEGRRTCLLSSMNTPDSAIYHGLLASHGADSIWSSEEFPIR